MAHRAMPRPRRSGAVRRAAAAVLVALVAGCGSAPPAPSGVPAPGSPAVPSLATPAPSPVAPPVGASASQAAPASGFVAGSPAPATGSTSVLVPLVPVTGFWSSESSISLGVLAAAVSGGPRPVYVAAPDLPWLAASLAVTPGANVHALAPAAVLAAVQASPGSLGVLRPEDVGPSVRALAVGSVSLFGVGPLRDLASWPLTVREPAGAAPSTFDPAAAWTLVAGGDVMLDRYVYQRTVIDGLGADYPWNGGDAKVTSTHCCGYPGFAVATTATAGAAGTLRAYLQRADLALANLEGPAPSDFRYHPSGLVFSMDPRLLVGLKDAGIDMVSLANNHIGNWGPSGIASTISNLDALGITHAGAGPTSGVARSPAWLTADGLRIAVLAYNGIGGTPNATATSAGAAGLSLASATADIRAARAAGADVVIVFPHWGVEYTDRLNAQQASLGPALLRAGADAVIGGHSHWAGPIRVIGDKLIVYSMGDFVFDLTHDTRTQEGILVELTFSGRHLAQVVLRPTLIVGEAQPGFLLPWAGGSALLAQIRTASIAAGMR